jgi:hypothetical protein
MIGSRHARLDGAMSSDFEHDWDRRRRTGIAEAVMSDRKSVAQLDAIGREALGVGRNLLFTRLAGSQYGGLHDDLRRQLDYDPTSRTAILGPIAEPASPAQICVVTAGTSDLPAAREATRTLTFNGFAATLVVDVGVAGLWRLMKALDTIRMHRVVIAAAGMEGALFSVLAGLVDSLVIALPTSVGYGVSANGITALHSALASCAPGVVVVNVDNGFGAACAAIKAIQAAAPVGDPASPA